MAAVAILTGSVLLLSRQEDIQVDQIISRKGLHWHAKLTIYIKGEKQEIPAEIGIGAVEQPIHTHDATGEIHMELGGLVTKDQLKLAKFFQIWGKQFNSNCIFDKCNGDEGKVKMIINGQENQEFENYQMRDGDNIEIRYE